MSGASRPLDVRELGVVDYREGLELQQSLVAQRRAGEVPDTLLLLEHPHVITLGSSGDRLSRTWAIMVLPAKG